jgi:hypothetical protein
MPWWPPSSFQTYQDSQKADLHSCCTTAIDSSCCLQHHHHYHHLLFLLRMCLVLLVQLLLLQLDLSTNQRRFVALKVCFIWQRSSHWSGLRRFVCSQETVCPSDFPACTCGASSRAGGRTCACSRCAPCGYDTPHHPYLSCPWLAGS